MSKLKNTHMPSTRLIEEVKGLKEVKLEKYCTENSISIKFKETMTLNKNGIEITQAHRKTYNLYEFANDCKKWAVQRGYTIYSESGTKTALSESYVMRLYDHERMKTLWDENEPKSIFKACEWLMDHLSKNDGK